MTQAQAASHVAKEKEQSRRRVEWDVASLLVLLAAVGGFGLWRLARDEGGLAPLPSPDLRSIPPTASGWSPRPAPVVAESARPASTPLLPGPWEATPSRAPAEQAPAAPASPSPSPAKTATEALEEDGAKALDTALARAAHKAGDLGRRFREYDEACQGRRTGFVAGNCEQVEQEIRREATQIASEIEAAEDQARRSWVKPGAVREIRAKHRMDEWEALWRSVAALKR